MAATISRNTNINNPSIIWTRERYDWQGCYSGYDRLFGHLSQQWQGNQHSIWRKPVPLRWMVRRMFAPLVSQAQSSISYDVAGTLVELKTLWLTRRFHADIIHFTYLERHFGLLQKWLADSGTRLVGTAHQPDGWWKMFHQRPELVAALDMLLVVSRAQATYFEQFLPGRVHFVPLAVDTTYFSPSPVSVVESAPRCVFGGQWLRDLTTLASVIDEVLKRNPAVRIDIVVPRQKRHDERFQRIARHPQVYWYCDIPDEQLRQLYREATLLLFPVINATSNNMIVEAIACGLPIVSNDVGGMKDYARREFADLLPVGDVSGMASAVLRLIENRDEQKKRSKAARCFAEQNLAMAVVAQRMTQLYRELV